MLLVWLVEAVSKSAFVPLGPPELLVTLFAGVAVLLDSGIVMSQRVRRLASVDVPLPTPTNNWSFVPSKVSIKSSQAEPPFGVAGWMFAFPLISGVVFITPAALNW